MKPITTIQLGLLRLNADAHGSHCTRSMRVEWTPESECTIPIRSTWRDAIGAPLTDHRITHYMRQGRYGDEARLRVLAHDKALADKRNQITDRTREARRIARRYV
jgi:hypothetical protein